MLMLSEHFSPAELHSLQASRLAKLLQLTLKDVPFYSQTHDFGATSEDGLFEVLGSFPLLDESTVQAAGSRMFSARSVSVRHAEIHTGGTTGRPLTIRASLTALRENYAFFEHQKRWAGIGPDSRVATFAGRPIVRPDQSKPPFWRDNWLFGQRLFSSYHIGSRTVDAYRDGLRAFRPELIDSYPSSLEPIARRLLETGDDSIRPRAIITSSETLTDETRALIESAFACRVFDHYGSAEMVALVTQCDHGSYHVNPEYGVLELLNDAGQPVAVGEIGEVVATGFINDFMPLIRYRMGDLASWREGDCSCGRFFPRLERILGRMDDVVITPDGRRIGDITVDLTGEALMIAGLCKMVVINRDGHGMDCFT